MDTKYVKPEVKGLQKTESKGCPKCKFNGKDSDTIKFSQEQINRFPKGYYTEKRPKIITKIIAGQQVQEFVIENNNMIFLETMKCPICGYTENKK